MHNKSINKLIIFVLVLVMTILIPVNSLASREEPFNKYGVLREGDVLLYIENSVESQTVRLASEYVTYYYGDDYTIVKDNQGYSKIDFKENGRIFVNNKEIKSKISLSNINKSEFNLLSLNTLSLEEWIPYGDPIYREYDIIGLAPGVLGGVIGGLIGGFIGEKITEIVITSVTGAIIGTILGGRFPEYYVSIISQDYYKKPIITPRPEIKTINEIYHGPKYDRYQNYWKTYTN